MPDGLDEHEQALARRAADDPQAFHTLYRRYFQRVYGYVAARIAEQHDAEDVVSEIFLHVVKYLPQLRNERQLSFAAWLFTIARTVVSDHYRRNGNSGALVSLDFAPLVAAESTPDRIVSEREESARLLALVGALPERKREVIVLRYYGGLRNQEIADVLGIGEKTVSAYLSRALNDLQAQYSTFREKGVDDEP